jgi:hypothetical protein
MHVNVLAQRVHCPQKLKPHCDQCITPCLLARGPHTVTRTECHRTHLDLAPSTLSASQAMLQAAVGRKLCGTQRGMPLRTCSVGNATVCLRNVYSCPRCTACVQMSAVHLLYMVSRELAEGSPCTSALLSDAFRKRMLPLQYHQPYLRKHHHWRARCQKATIMGCLTGINNMKKCTARDATSASDHWRPIRGTASIGMRTGIMPTCHPQDHVSGYYPA